MNAENNNIEKIVKINKYIEDNLFNSLFVFHPFYSIDGRITKNVSSELHNLGTQVVISVDRNVFSDLLQAVKNGSFDACKNKKETTAFLFWTIENGFGISPYDAMKEQAFIENDNASGNKENDIFNYLYNNVSIQLILDSFFKEGIRFTPKAFPDAINNEKLYFLDNNADYMFLHASILHLVYELRSGKNIINQFKSMMNWYFQECLISSLGLTYIVLLFTKDGITPPHDYNNNDKVLHGCMNEAMDIYYFQEIDPRRYPSDKITFMLATHDKVMKDVFQIVYCQDGIETIEQYLIKLCNYAPKSKRDIFTKILLEEFHNHKKLDVNPSNAYSIAKKVCEQEESRLKHFLGISRMP